MPSYQERSEINRRLAEQAYFDAKRKKIEPQKKDVRIGGMDGQTGRYQVLHADGGFSNNGVRTFDGTPPSDRFVRGQQNPNSNAIALGYRDYVRTEFLNRVAALTTQIIFLFQKENKLYVGGDRDEPELIYEAEEGESITQARITKTGEGIDDYKAMFVSEKGDSKTYLNTYLDGGVFAVDYDSPHIELSFKVWDGSFVGTGTKDMLNDEDRDVVNDRVMAAQSAFTESVNASRNALQNQFAPEGVQDLPYIGLGLWYFDAFTPFYYSGDWEFREYYYQGYFHRLNIITTGREDEIPTTNEIKTFFGYTSEAEGKSYKATSIVVAYFDMFNYSTEAGYIEGLREYYGAENVSFGFNSLRITLGVSSDFVLSPSRFDPAPEPSISLFSRPEDNVLTDIQYDTYPDQERILDVYYTEDKKITKVFYYDEDGQIIVDPEDLPDNPIESEFDTILGFDSESIIFTKNEDILIKGTINKDLEIPEGLSIYPINNFIGGISYLVVALNEEGDIIETTEDLVDNPIEIEEEGTLNVVSINVSESPLTISTPTPIEYSGISEELKAHIVNYSVFF